MDEEDMREAEESRTMSTADEFAGLGSTNDDPKRRDAVMDLFKPAGETIGVKLLKKMGWKEGQGIGARVRRKAHLGEVEVENNQAETTHLFAPEDPPMISFNRKFDHKGLGLEGEAGLESDSKRVPNPASSKFGQDNSDDDEGTATAFSRSVRKSTEGPKAKKSAFGVGILNDTGSDDEDPYQMGPKISYNRVIGGDKKLQKKRDGVQSVANPLVRERPIFTAKKAKGKFGFRKCHDGRLPLDGFVLSAELDSFASIDLQDEKYKPPMVPEGWISKQQATTELFGEAHAPAPEAAKLSNMDAKTRAAILGEEQMPGKSVFDFLTPAARNRIVAASGKSNLPAALSERPPPGFEATEEDRGRAFQDLVPALDVEVAMQALNRGVGGWMPYAEDEGKRARYRAFLEIRAGIREGLPERLVEMSQDDWVNEMHEFARAAQVFKPVTGMMASRFTSSLSQARLASDRPDSSGQGEALLILPPTKPDDPAVSAAKLGMFGPLTRSVKSFYPTRLLCKRFDVKPPANVPLDPDDGSGKSAATNSMANRTPQSRFHSAGHQMEPSGDSNRTDSKRTGSTPAHQKLLQSPGEVALEAYTSTGPTETTHAVDAAKNDALEAQRPGDEVFRAIFGSDEEED
jgi:G patch domain-containing protein 1